MSEGCSKYDALATTVNAYRMAPPPCLSFDPDAWGLRPALAERGIGFDIQSSVTFTYDLLGHNAKPQTYGGQNPTWQGQIIQLDTTYDLNRIGFTPGSQFQFSANWGASTYHQAFPNLTSVAALAIRQPLADGLVELRYGLIPLIFNFYGLSLAAIGFGAAQGPLSTIPYEVGLSLQEPSLAGEVTVHYPGNRLFYNSLAVGQSTTPMDEHGNNPYGVRLTPGGTRPLVIDEFGYGSPTGSTWARAGAIFNWTRYTHFATHADVSGNYAFYVGLTQQLTQIGNPMRGLFMDLKLDYSPQDRNVFARDVLLSVYYKGPFASRPFDMASLGFGYAAFSKDLHNFLSMRTPDLPTNTKSVTASYAALVRRGIFAITTLSYTTAPAGPFYSNPKSALLFSENLSFAF